MRLLDWLARLVLLVVSALATLALVGSLASVSNTPLGQAFPGDVRSPEPATSGVSEQQADATPSRPGSADPAGTPTMSARVPAPARDDDRDDLARWLKALTYAVLALAGFAAAGLVALVRIAHHLGRLAER